MREPKKQRRYTAEFKSDALALIHRDKRPLVHIAEDLGMNYWTLRGWYRQDMAKNKRRKTLDMAKKGIPTSESDSQKAKRLERELARLQRKVDQLEEDREILKKAAAFFANENK